MMSDSKSTRLLNPWVLHIQKFGLELKCPLCLDYLTAPMLLPCDHIFCKSCIPRSTQTKSECPVCTNSYAYQELRPARFIENMVAIYKNLEASILAHALHPIAPGPGRVLGRSPALLKRPHDNQAMNERVETDRGNASSSRVFLALTANQSFQPPPVHSFKNGVGKLTTGCRAEDFGSSEGNRRLSSLGSQLRTAETESFEAAKTDMTQLTQPSPGSPPSFGDTRGSDNDSSDQGCYNSLERLLVESPAETNHADGSRLKRHGDSSFGAEEGYIKDSKRHKKLNNGPAEGDFKQLATSNSQSLTVPGPQVEERSTMSYSELPVVSGHSNDSQFTCAFCQTSSLSEALGPMIHYVNGNLVEGEEANSLDVIHVHTKCTEWAPQAYFEGETVKNLEKELARGAKLKCCRCGLKGAALGCYVKSCKMSYHFPCAMEVKGCRFDTEDYLVLCPAHTSSRFPSEKYKSRKSMLKDNPVQTQTTSGTLTFWKDMPEGAKKWVLCGSALSSEEKLLLAEFAEMTGLTVSKNWKPNVTHVIANTDSNGACTRTLKVLMAILKGCWVLKIDWIIACMKAMRPVDEEPYEVCTDSHGSCDGPKTGRLRALANAPKLFNGLNFYFVGDFLPTIGNELRGLIKAAGGNILESKESLLVQNNGHQEPPLPCRVVIVYNLELPEDCQLGEEVTILYERLSEAQDLAASFKGQVVGHTWILESIAACKLLPFVHE